MLFRSDEEELLSPSMRELMDHLREVLASIDNRICAYDAEFKRISQENESCRLLMSIPGIGIISATALVAAVGDVSVFKNGREMAAWLGLVPRQHATGGKMRLFGISKRGDSYLRMLLIHGARAVLRFADKKSDRTSRWVSSIAERRGKNVAAVALANKNVRIVWALLKKGEAYRVSKSA